MRVSERPAAGDSNYLTRAAPPADESSSDEKASSGARLRCVVGSKQECQSLDNLPQSCGRQDADAFAESTPIDGAKLGDIYDARTRQSAFAKAEAHIPWHRPKAEIRRDHRDDGRGDRTSVEPIVLHDQGR